MSDLESLRLAIAYQMGEYLAGRVGLEELREWAWAILEADDTGTELPQEIAYWIAQDALYRIIMLDPSEPDDCRTTLEDLQESLNYLRGKTPFPQERIPRANLRELRQAMASKIEDYLAGRTPLILLIAWTACCEGYIQGLLRPEPSAYQIVRYAIDTIRRIDPVGKRPDRASGAEVRLAVSYLKATIAFSKGG